MAKRIVLSENGLTGGIAPTGYKYLGISGGNLSIQSGATISNAGGSSEFTYEVGEYVSDQGGVIFHRYLTGSTQSYLVVDLQNLASSAWSNITNSETSGNSLWSGDVNTQFIITQSGATSGAAFLCDSSTNGGKNDWYLPAIHELNKLYCNMLEVAQGLEIVGGTQLSLSAYWSSTENFSVNACNFNFLTGLANVTGKSNSQSVRAVRKFSI
jgi:hypothetical protein